MTLRRPKAITPLMQSQLGARRSRLAVSHLVRFRLTSLSRKSMNFSAGPSADMITKYTHLDPAIQERNVTSKNIWTLGTIYVSFESDPNSDKKNTVNTTTLKAFFTLMESHKFSSGILISSAPPTPQAKNLMMAAADQGLRIECFTESELLVNITRHELVPKHILLSQEEKKQLLERYRVKETQLPRIQMADPVARYLGLRRNDVVKIIRKSETAGRYASYRWCLG